MRLFGLFEKLIMHYGYETFIKYRIIGIYLRYKGLWYVIIFKGNDFLMLYV